MEGVKSLTFLETRYFLGELSHTCISVDFYFVQ